MSRDLLKSLSLFLIIVILLSSGLMGCGGSKSSEKVLTIAYDKDADTLDHFKTGVYSDALIYVYDRLITRDYDYNYKPGLAESWDISDDGMVWTFHLKKGVKFHDGTPLTAEDVAWCIEKIIDPETGSPAQSDFAAVKGAKAVDNHTVEIHLKHPFPNLLFV
ncbi:MAG: ABC transporter substrate-binding protein, partial [Caldicoprobacterales bacterium]